MNSYQSKAENSIFNANGGLNQRSAQIIERIVLNNQVDTLAKNKEDLPKNYKDVNAYANVYAKAYSKHLINQEKKIFSNPTERNSITQIGSKPIPVQKVPEVPKKIKPLVAPEKTSKIPGFVESKVINSSAESLPQPIVPVIFKGVAEK